uniref:Uncharacterized protein n=1 Tax=Octopus bimaculoides TaxID=37653 RepID=A0A0L8I2B6_OCTBM
MQALASISTTFALRRLHSQLGSRRACIENGLSFGDLEYSALITNRSDGIQLSCDRKCNKQTTKISTFIRKLLKNYKL